MPARRPDAPVRPLTGRTAVVVGSGPNGLSAAISLAEAGADVRVIEGRSTIGGGTRTEELTGDGLLHDVCSAAHPMALASPALTGYQLERHGLRWAWPEIDLVHLLDGDRAGVLWRDLDRTAAGLGEDGPRWRRVFGPLVRRFDDLAEDALGPMLRWPSHPLTLARFGVGAALPANWLTSMWRRPETRGLFAGVAAHAMTSLRIPFSSAVGLMLTTVAHRHGWPVAVGGSAAISSAMAARLHELGGRIETDTWVRSIDQLGRPDITVLDLNPHDAAALFGARMPPRRRRSLDRYRYGPGAYKVDFAVRGGVPWTNPQARQAGTVHLGGTLGEVHRAERDAGSGRLSSAPFTLVGQQYLADPSRSSGDLHPVWTYAHVPHGFTGDATEAIIGQLERFAPGFSERIVSHVVSRPADLEAGNPNYVGGNINTGANDGLQLLLRPGLAANPYRTGIRGVYLCSAATPPGPGVHGMGGFHAARAAVTDFGESR